MMDTLETARAAVFAALDRCPVCGARLRMVEKSDALESLEFDCEAAFFRAAGCSPAIARVCDGPSYVALAGLEREAAAKAVGKAVA